MPEPLLPGKLVIRVLLPSCLFLVHKTYLLNEIDTGLQVHTKVNKFPLDAFFLVLFLFQDEHVMVEELLESLIGVVDTQLLKAVEL